MFVLLLKAWSKKRSGSLRMKRAKGMMRAALVLAVMTTALSLLGARRARAELAQAGLRVGKDLMPLVNVLGGASTVSLNGQKVLMKYDGSKMPVREVLDAAEAACRAGGVRAPVQDAKDARAKDLESAILRMADFGVMRTGDDREGLVLCFAKGEGTPDTLRAQIEELQKTGDLGSLGKMRYVYARRDGNATAVLAAITDDSFSIDAFKANPETDAPGTDDPALPRPKGSVRFLSAAIEGTPYATRGYRTRLPEDDVRADFDRGMVARGFTTLEVESKNGLRTNAYLKDGVMVTFAAVKDKSGDTLVSIGSLGADQRPPAGRPVR